MSEYINFLVTVLYGDRLLRCALRVKLDLLPGDCVEYPMEYRDLLHGLLPLHIQTCGPIVAVERLDEIHVVFIPGLRNRKEGGA